MNDCDCARECENCVYIDVLYKNKPCKSCVNESGFICKVCEEELKQARFEKYLEEKEEFKNV